MKSARKLKDFETPQLCTSNKNNSATFDILMEEAVKRLRFIQLEKYSF